jgi:hypothetical protein
MGDHLIDGFACRLASGIDQIAGKDAMGRLSALRISDGVWKVGANKALA